jgi:hypothetical protein
MPKSQRPGPPRFSILALLFLPTLLGCRGEGPQSDSSLDLEVAISPTPPAVGPARLIISLHDTSGAPLSGAEISVEGNMTHAGMVPVLATAQEEGPGQYLVPEFTFTMAGDWFLTLRATLPDGRTIQIREETDVASRPGGSDAQGGGLT